MTADNQIPWPLNDNAALISLISAVSGEPAPTVTRKLLQEEKCLGWNVREDLLAQQLTPHEWNEDLIHFYSQTNAFLYETAVWNRRPLKIQMRQWILNFLSSRCTQPARILSYGDGLGFDSLHWAGAGHEVTYFEVSADCITFAREVFQQNQTPVQQIHSEQELPAEEFDLVICLDVLEHVPEPAELLTRFRQWLKPDGLLITHAPFFLVHPCYSTHLKSNRKWSGSLDLYRNQGFQPIDSRFFWDPIVLKKSENSAPPPRVPLRTIVGGHLLRHGRGPAGKIHCQLARLMSRGERHWADDLQRRITSEPDSLPDHH